MLEAQVANILPVRREAAFDIETDISHCRPRLLVSTPDGSQEPPGRAAHVDDLGTVLNQAGRKVEDYLGQAFVAGYRRADVAVELARVSWNEKLRCGIFSLPVRQQHPLIDALGDSLDHQGRHHAADALGGLRECSRQQVVVGQPRKPLKFWQRELPILLWMQNAAEGVRRLPRDGEGRSRQVPGSGSNKAEVAPLPL